MRLTACAAAALGAALLGPAVAAGQAQRPRPPRAPTSAALVAEGRVLLGSKDLDAAKTKFEQALERDPRSASAHDLLGFVLGLQGRTAEAIAEFERAVAIEPSLFEAQYHLGATLWWTKETGRARAVLERAVLLRPDHAEARYYLGVAKRQLGDLPAAIADLRLAVRR